MHWWVQHIILGSWLMESHVYFCSVCLEIHITALNYCDVVLLASAHLDVTPQLEVNNYNYHFKISVLFCLCTYSSIFCFYIVCFSEKIQIFHNLVSIYSWTYMISILSECKQYSNHVLGSWSYYYAAFLNFFLFWLKCHHNKIVM